MKPNKTKDENTNTDNTGIMKERSFASCLSASFNLYCSNFATIFKHTWLPSLVLALTMSAGTLLTAAPLSVTVTAALGVCAEIVIGFVVGSLGEEVLCKVVFVFCHSVILPFVLPLCGV